jgi:hypothetical protein
MIKTVKKYLVPHAENDYKPHLLRERAVTVVACIALVLFCTSLGSSYILNKTDFGAAVLPSVLVDLTNNQRLAEGGKALAVNGTLEAAALMKAKDMAENHYFAHTSPTGISPWYWFSKAGYRFSYAGENLAVNFNESTDVENAWIASPTHYANLISDKFDETGIATYQGTYEGQPTTFVVQLFGKQSASTRTSAPVNNKKVASTEEAKPTPKVAVVPEVKGESIALKQAPVDPKEPAPVLMVEDPTFTVAQNINETQPAPTQNSSLTKYSTAAERLLVHQARYVQYIYLGLIALIYLVLISMIVIEIRTQHFKNIALAVLLLCLLGGLSYINSSFVLSFV